MSTPIDPTSTAYVAATPRETEIAEALASLHTPAQLLRAALLAIYAEGKYGTARCLHTFQDGTEGVAVLELEGRADRQIWEEQVRLIRNSWTLAGGSDSAAPPDAPSSLREHAAETIPDPAEDVAEMRRLLKAQREAHEMATDYHMEDLNSANRAFYEMQERIGKARYDVAFAAATAPDSTTPKETCQGFEVEPGVMSGCTAKDTGAEDCPVCGAGA